MGTPGGAVESDLERKTRELQACGAVVAGSFAGTTILRFSRVLCVPALHLDIHTCTDCINCYLFAGLVCRTAQLGQRALLGETAAAYSREAQARGGAYVDIDLGQHWLPQVRNAATFAT